MKSPGSSYRDDALSPKERFDEVETTMSHLLRRPHPALGGRSYGAALFRALKARGYLPRPKVLEVGAGAAFVSTAFASESDTPLDYTFVDLSRRLLDFQRSKLKSARAICADMEQLPFRSSSFDGLVLANEVIADLPITKGPDGTPINSGAYRFVDELWRVLSATGAACLTEFGGDFRPSGVRLSGAFGRGEHVEHSIHFGELEARCRSLGFQVERVKVAQLLEIDPTVRVASYHDLLRLRRLVPSVPIVAFAMEELISLHPLVTRFFRFEFPSIGSPGFPHPGTQGGFAELFEALLLKKPALDVTHAAS